MYWLPFGVWNIVCDFLIHKKKNSKHLKNTKEIKQYNLVMYELPKITFLPIINLNANEHYTPRIKRKNNKYYYIFSYLNVWGEKKNIYFIETIVLYNENMFDSKEINYDKMVKDYYNYI